MTTKRKPAVKKAAPKLSAAEVDNVKKAALTGMVDALSDQYNGLALWEKVEKTDPDRTKAVSYGAHHFTAINATYQIKLATEQWGPYGGAWGVKDQNFTFRKIEGIYFCDYQAEFYSPVATFQINTSIQYFNNGKFDSDYRKKVETDALTKALSRLGFNADVFMGMFEDNKYVDQRIQEEKIDEVELDPADIYNVLKYIAEADGLEFYALLQSREIEYKLALMAEYYKRLPKGTITKEKARLTQLREEGKDRLAKLLDDIAGWLTENNISAIEEVLNESSDELNALVHSKVSGL